MIQCLSDVDVVTHIVSSCVRAVAVRVTRTADVVPSRLAGVGGGGQPSQRKERLALTCNCDSRAAGEVEFVGDLGPLANVLGDAEADDLRHPSLRAVPVHLEAVGVPLVEVVGGDEVEDVAVLVRARSLHDRGQETGLRVGAVARLSGGDFEFVTTVGNCHDGLLGFCPVEGFIPSVFTLYHVLLRYARYPALKDARMTTAPWYPGRGDVPMSSTSRLSMSHVQLWSSHLDSSGTSVSLFTQCHPRVSSFHT